MKFSTHRLPVPKCRILRLNCEGFALVIALSLMAFVVLLLLSISALVRVELAGADQTVQQMKAEQVALLSLNLAIGKLQQTTGADTRITAPASTVVDSSGAIPHVTGVWRSWEGLDHDIENGGKPIAPNYEIKKEDYNAGSPESGRFLGWLVSSAVSGYSAETPPSVQETVNTVTLLGDASVGVDSSDPDYAKEHEVHVVPTDIADEAVYAWWVQGLNTKALIEQAEPLPDADAFEQWANRLNSNAHYDAEVFGIPDSDELNRLVTFSSFKLIDASGSTDVGEIAQQNYHSLTHYSRGLLTNAATGGWKRDLSLFGEKWQSLDHNFIDANPDYRVPWGTPVSGSGESEDEDEITFSTFNLAPGETNEAALKWDVSGNSALIYGWGTDRQVSMTWNSLADFASLYKNLQQDANGNPYYNFYNSLGLNAGGNTVATGERFSIVEPMIVRWQTVLSLASQEVISEEGDEGDEGDEAGPTYVPLVGVSPSVTYYNPYNVAIDSSGYNEDLLQLAHKGGEVDFPVRLSFEIDSETITPWKLPLLMGMNAENGNQNRWNIKPKPSTLADKKWKPGESRIIGRPGITGITSGFGVVSINAGMSDVPYFTKLRNSLKDKTPIPENGYAGDQTYEVKWQRFEHSGFVSGWLRNNSQRVAYSRHLTYHVSDDSSLIDEKSPINLSENERTLKVRLDEVTYDEEKFEPFLSMALTKRNLFDTYAASKGYINNKLILPPWLTSGEGIEKSSYEWKIDRLNGQVDPNILNYNDDLAAGTDVSGFVGTSFASESGLARWVTAELPTQALLSICELQHFDPAYINPHVPRVANALGNSHATPFIQKDEIQIAGQDGYDHSYVFNHIMFDDWFVSSISPELQPFSANIVAGREIDAVLKDFLTGEGELKNAAYVPAFLLSEEAAEEYVEDTYKNSANSWASVAADLEVKGMFNVNSTSVDAWKALLRNVKDGRVPHQTIDTENLGSWEMDLGPEYADAPVSRTSVTGDEFSSGNDAQLLAQPLEWTDTQLDALAEEIVKQVKLRGPFLSLSEFINRQLSEDDDLALAGAVESALMALADYGVGNSKNPYSEILSVFPVDEMESYIDQDGVEVQYPKYLARQFSDHESYYEFPKAAEGHVAYGTPGWTRQADILRPIAPVLSVRDDSFTVRSYGATKDLRGNVVAEAWCEAIVKRTAEYVDPSNEKDDFVDLSDANEAFGRKFEIVAFRWLTEDEL
ncbi:hypothetical protein SH580_05580 [Coraliomargarita algicola]|uniref:Verru_Chthon cassette protein A n=1 Tax=Coraliomargarita algicola TaxID=3092156 RepID=A0ABZ0RPZ1_9BACT|nr:hypothetical protein [Coraliomargarita sp. J2-16]WPJ97178.1 hypothetical protein SH580_05580 [Coraliomargarita sp. J2-16]